VRNRRELGAGFKDATPGYPNDDVDSAKARLKKSGKMQRELPTKRLREMGSMDNTAQGEYDESAYISILVRKSHTNASIHYRRPVGYQSQPQLHRGGRGRSPNLDVEG